MAIIKYACPIVLFIFCILAICFAFTILWSEDRKDTENRLLITLCFSSAIWSIGFGALILQTNTEVAYWCRVFGMIGTMLYLITGQMLISYLSGISKRVTILLNSFAYLGYFIYFLTVERSQTIYYLTPGGMTYSFKPGLANTIYTAYSLVLAILMFVISIYMCFSKVKRIRFFGKIFMITVAAMLIGTILDTVFPLLGFTAIPGSTLMQFLGMLVVYMAIRANNRSKINIANMSEFIYYSLSMPVLVYNSHKQLQIANDAAAKFLNINQDEIKEKNIHLHTLFDVEDDSIFTFKESNKDIDCICVNNQIHCNLAINKISDCYDDVIGYIIIVTDLSERIKNLQHLEEAKQEAEAANRSKSAFLANMSHEIRTPMNAILGFSELILKLEASDKTIHEYATDIKSSCLNLLGIINDILDISKLDSGKAELSCNNYHTASLLQEVYHIIDIQAKKKGLQFTMNTDPMIPNELYGDKTRIRGILINLLSNAVKYTEQGKVDFTIRLTHVHNGIATLEYIVSDTGIGLKESSMEHLYDSFARFDAIRNTNIEGTGLGLSIVNGYVNLMEGKIHVDSVYEEGTTFTVTLDQQIVDDAPLEFITEITNESNSLNAAEIKIRDTRVLVTDDNHINLKVIKNTLEYYGLMVDTAASGMEAIQLCAKNSYDLIFMDQMMPHMNGIQAMHKIRALSSHYAAGSPCKIIVLTANAILGVRDELIAEGFDEYLSKPIQFRELEKIMRLFISSEKYIPNKKHSSITDTGVIIESSQIPNAVTNQSLEDLLPQIDIASGLAYCNDNLAFYVEILRLLYDEASEQLNTLQLLWSQQDYPNYIVHIHSLKTQLLNIGYVLLAEKAKALEFAGKEKRYEYIEENQNAFIREYEALTKQLENVFATMKE